MFKQYRVPIGQEQQQSITQKLKKSFEEKLASAVESFQHKTKELEDAVSHLFSMHFPSPCTVHQLS